MNERIAEVRRDSGLTQEEFGSRIGGLSRNYIWMIEKGDRTPSDRTISDICREFGVNETWLRTGEGPMFKPRSRNEELFDFLNNALDEGDGIKARLLTVMARLTDDQWELLADMARKLAQEAKEKAGPD